MIKRKLYNLIKNYINTKEMLFIVGPRQAGKTTLMNTIISDLKAKNENFIYFNLDIDSDLIYFKSQNDFINKLKLEFGNKKAFVFIDEIQRKENAGLFLKGIYDRNLPYKFIVSGSGSIELKEKISESLSGRKIMFELSTISFEEFTNYITEYKYESNFQEFFSVEKEKAKSLLEQYLNFGGYPRILTAQTFQEKKLIIDEIFKSYIEKDITYLLKVEKNYAFIETIKYISHITGKMLNFNELCTYVNISNQTLKNYLHYAEKTFIIRKITPYFTNPLKELVKSPIFYFYDLGLRNYIATKFGTLSSLDDYSFVFQNFIFNILIDKIKHSPHTIHYWRTKDKAEVDFILKTTEKIIPIEVKYSNSEKLKPGRSMLNFINKYKPEKAFIINLSYYKEITIGKTKIYFIPYYKLFFLDLI